MRSGSRIVPLIAVVDHAGKDVVVELVVLERTPDAPQAFRDVGTH